MPQGNPNYPWRRVPKQSTWPAGDPRWTRKIPSLQGGPLGSRPSVTTVGVNSITATSANIIGAINPNGSDTLWWIAYDTQLPLSPGAVTPAQDAGSGTVPVTVTLNLTGLTTGVLYYVAVVGQSAGGTIYGQTLSFAAATPAVTTSTPVAPFGSPSVTIPHFQFPFVLVGAADGTATGAAVVEQDTVEEVASNVGVVVSCPVGACSQLPTFGGPVMTFAQEPIDTGAIETAVQVWEPRATEDIVSQLMLDEQTWGITLNTSVVAAQNV